MNRKLAGINSLTELRYAQNSIERELSFRKNRLNEDYESIKNIMSFDYQLTRAVDRIAMIRSRMSEAVHGFSFVSHLIEKFREYKADRQQCRTEPAQSSDCDSNHQE